MLPSCYTAGWDKRKFSAFGLSLVPLTLAHAKALYIVGSPLVIAGESAGLDDVLNAAAICSLPVPPCTSDELFSVVRAMKRMEVGDYVPQVKVVNDYFLYYATPLRRFSEGSEQRMPWPWGLAASLMRFYGYTETRAWSELVPTAFWLNAAVGIQNGDTSYATLDDYETIQLMMADGVPSA